MEKQHRKRLRLSILYCYYGFSAEDKAVAEHELSILYCYYTTREKIINFYNVSFQFFIVITADASLVIAKAGIKLSILYCYYLSILSIPYLANTKSFNSLLLLQGKALSVSEISFSNGELSILYCYYYSLNQEKTLF